ncbi:hypothetical protein HS041_06940 [Planomonospora sp. ID67723]|uniref:hypothetical protein n=1 Tax=Planomonospora sp. ID67723 TaxID=2738134 RepID=UPI0018C39967|nr:hypothetical protein [Planomonospora sp. ID67723]MBG0827496.1 hypothetical protein [Planomonospora sp. ID67723]
MSVWRRPAVWVAVSVLSILLMFVLPGDVAWPLNTVIPAGTSVAAMAVAVVTAYREAARIRAGRSGGAQHPRDGS